MSAESSTPSHGDASTPLEDPFSALLQDINPYVDDIPTKPEFHRFLDLPMELRCKIYVQYFLDNTDSIACKSWPTLLIDWITAIPNRGRKSRRAFLPKLCLASKSLQKGQLDCLISPIELVCGKIPNLNTGLQYLQKSLKARCLLDHIRHISIRRTNNCYNRVIDNFWNEDVSELDVEKRSRHLMHNLGALLPKFPQLRQLSFAVHAPLRYVGVIPNTANVDCVRALSINRYIKDFDTQALLALKELTKVTISGSAGRHNCPEEFSVPALTSVEQDGKIENLQAVKDLAREIKDGFQKQDQDVVVELHLTYGGDKEEQIVMD